MKKKLLSFILAICMILPCSLALTACGSNPPDDPPAHTHNWSTEWTTNSSEHWYTCDGCDEKKDKGIHTFVSKTCSVCGYVQGEDPEPSVPTVANVRDLEIITIPTVTGTATLVKLPDGKDMLIDAGDGTDEGNTYLQDLIYDNDKNGIIDYLVLTNTETQTSGGVSMLFDMFNIENFYRPDVRSSHTTATSLSSEYNSGNSVYVDDTEEYANALKSASESDCTKKVIDETSCDIDYTFKDNGGNTYNYKIDFMTPITATSRDSLFDNSVMIAIEYKGAVVLLTSEASNDLIDAYCDTYGTKYDVDVLSVLHRSVDDVINAISRSDLRETYFLEKISLDDGDYSIVIPISESGEIGDTLDELEGVSTLYSMYDYFSITTKVTSAGVLDVTPE